MIRIPISQFVKFVQSELNLYQNELEKINRKLTNEKKCLVLTNQLKRVYIEILQHSANYANAKKTLKHTQ